MQIMLVVRLPQIQNITKGSAENDAGSENRAVMRISPYPPNFSKMAARIIDPAMGAST